MSIPPRSRRRPGDTITEAARDIPGTEYTTVKTPRYRIAPSVHAYSSSDISVTSGGTATVTLNRIKFDTHEFKRDDSGKLYVPITGYYMVRVNVRWNGSVNTSRVLCLRIRHVDLSGNDVLIAHDVQVTSGNNVVLGHSTSTTWHMDKNSYFYAQAAVAAENATLVADTSSSDNWGSHVAATFLGVANSRIWG